MRHCRKNKAFETRPYCSTSCPSVYSILLLQSFLTKDVKQKLSEELKIITCADKLIQLCLRIFLGFWLQCVVTSFSLVVHLLHIQAQVFVPVTGMFLEHFEITPFGSRRLVHGGTANVRGSAVRQFMSGQSPLKSSGHFSAHPLSRRAKELVHCADPRKLRS